MMGCTYLLSGRENQKCPFNQPEVPSVYQSPLKSTLLRKPFAEAPFDSPALPAGPATHDDSPPGVDKDPNVVPPSDLGDDKSGGNSDGTSDDKKVDKADKKAWKAMSI